MVWFCAIRCRSSWRLGCIRLLLPPNLCGCLSTSQIFFFNCPWRFTAVKGIMLCNDPDGPATGNRLSAFHFLCCWPGIRWRVLLFFVRIYVTLKCSQMRGRGHVPCNNTNAESE
ncbi:hypothetical protein BGZ61DRAFT_27572 [Ilyonectria robusta]|uniref:uncharacterized protein n=1 Tax=Ilyonectria robusta TaxID=1079257 RepID=UPI001E8DB2DA|nr:uncharacterized protein BGZ61DRAFT_27572 [Ilyonectria robusta]KAH8738071.1 hypothetical protein BGZ61DRAFT_27572 [Ilyonectria robusta]